MRVLSISGKKRSTKRRSSKLRRRKGRYSGGANSEEEVEKKQFERLAQATQAQAAKMEEFKNDDNDELYAGLGTSVELEQNKKLLTQMQSADTNPDFSQAVESLLSADPIEDSTIDFLFVDNGVDVDKSIQFIQNINGLKDTIINSLPVGIKTNEINKFNLFIKLILLCIDRVKTQSTDIRKRMLMLLFAIMHGVSVVQSELRRIKPDIDIPDIPQPADVDFSILELSDGLTPDEINEMTTAIASMKETMNESNSIDVQGKDLKNIYDKILQPLYDKLTVKPKLELVNPTDPRSVPPVNHSLLRPLGPPGPGNVGYEESNRQEVNAPKIKRVPTRKTRTPSVNDIPPPPSEPSPTTRMTTEKKLTPLEKDSSVLELRRRPSLGTAIRGGKSRKRKSRSRRSTRKKSRKSSRRRTRH